jgi:peptidylprolyl isomerase
MRRVLALTVIPLLAALALVGCGSSSSSTADTNSTVTATSVFGKAPTVTIPKVKASSKLAVKTLVKGTGATLTKSDAFVGNYSAYIWSGTTHKLATSTFTSNPAVFSGSLLPGLETALIGQKVGSRVLAVIPPKDAYGTSGNSSIGITGTDTLVFVIDLIQKFANNSSASGSQVSTGGHGLPTVAAVAAGTAPTIKIPSSAAPKSLTTTTLIKGTGAKVTKGETLVVQYVGVIWRTTKVFDSSWTNGAPFGFTVGASPEQVIPGWDKGLIGQTVGSRVMLTIPPADGYGSSGQSEAGIKGTDTLVFVIDIVGAVSSTSS